MTLAETASTFCQNILTDAALASADSAEEELAILENFLIDSSQIIVDIYSRYLFEREVFERRAEAELSADDLCELMLRCQRETYGGAIDGRYLHPYMWAWKSHYYRPGLSFYNFPYAFGMLFGLALYGIYHRGEPGFFEAYDSLLRDSGEATAAELAARFGLDISKPDFWKIGLSVMEKRIDRYAAI